MNGLKTLNGTRERRCLPRSGDALVDFVFRSLVDTLERGIEAVHIKKVLRDPDDRRRELHGILRERKIFLGRRKHRLRKTPIVSTLIHEAIHAAFPILSERGVLRLEQILWTMLSNPQKRYLRHRFIPRHEVKTEPSRD